MVKVNYIKYDNRIINNYDLIVIPYNDLLKRTLDKNVIKYPTSFDIIKKRIDLNDEDVKIIKYHNNIDLMFVKFPYYGDHIDEYNYISIYYKILSLIKINEYKQVLLPSKFIPYHYGFPINDSIKIDDLLYKYIYWFFDRKTIINLNIDIPL